MGIHDQAELLRMSMLTLEAAKMNDSVRQTYSGISLENMFYHRRRFKVEMGWICARLEHDSEAFSIPLTKFIWAFTMIPIVALKDH